MRFWAVLTILTQAAWFGGLLTDANTDLLVVLLIIAASSALSLAGGVLYQWWIEYQHIKRARASLRMFVTAGGCNEFVGCIAIDNSAGKGNGPGCREIRFDS